MILKIQIRAGEGGVVVRRLDDDFPHVQRTERLSKKLIRESQKIIKFASKSIKIKIIKKINYLRAVADAPGRVRDIQARAHRWNHRISVPVFTILKENV